MPKEKGRARTLLRVLDNARKAWPMETRENVSNDPRLTEAAEIRAVCDVSNHLTANVAIPQAEELERQHRDDCSDAGCLHEPRPP
jgi:hypothetical protein